MKYLYDFPGYFASVQDARRGQAQRAFGDPPCDRTPVPKTNDEGSYGDGDLAERLGDAMSTTKSANC